MSKNLTGKKMPKFKANATSEKEISSADFENKNLVIYFYPKIVHLDALQKVRTLEITTRSLKNSIQKF